MSTIRLSAAREGSAEIIPELLIEHAIDGTGELREEEALVCFIEGQGLNPRENRRAGLYLIVQESAQWKLAFQALQTLHRLRHREPEYLRLLNPQTAIAAIRFAMRQKVQLQQIYKSDPYILSALDSFQIADDANRYFDVRAEVTKALERSQNLLGYIAKKPSSDYSLRELRNAVQRQHSAAVHAAQHIPC